MTLESLISSSTYLTFSRSNWLSLESISTSWIFCSCCMVIYSLMLLSSRSSLGNTEVRDYFWLKLVLLLFKTTDWLLNDWFSLLLHELWFKFEFMISSLCCLFIRYFWKKFPSGLWVYLASLLWFYSFSICMSLGGSLISYCICIFWDIFSAKVSKVSFSCHFWVELFLWMVLGMTNFFKD